MRDVTVLTASIPSRLRLLERACASVNAQVGDHLAAHIIGVDHVGVGASRARNKLIGAVRTEWMLVLDDDDELVPEALDTLRRAADEHDADLIYPWYEVLDGGTDPFPGWYGPDAPYDEARVREGKQLHVSCLVRTELVQAVHGFTEPDCPGQLGGGEDMGLWLRLIDNGARVWHAPEKLLLWHHWGENGLVGNTSGRPWRELDIPQSARGASAFQRARVDLRSVDPWAPAF